MSNTRGNTLGQKIKFFRKRAGISQMKLEVAIGGSSGMVSRIEAGKVNPCKETVLEIGKVLGLNHYEVEYIIGITSLPVTEEESKRAKEEVHEVLQKRGKLAYLLDDRWRFVVISESFKRLLHLKPEGLEYAIGRTTAQVIVEPNSPVMEWVDQGHREELIREYLPVFYSRMSYLHGDPVYERTVSAIMENSFSRRIWEELERKNYSSPNVEEERIIHFDIMGRKFPLYYSGTILNQNSRFELVEFYTENKILNLLSKLI